MSEKQSFKPRQKLIDRRKAAGLSQYTAAHLVGCHRQTIIKLEKGEMGLSDEWLLRLAGAYGCTLDELSDDELLGQGGARLALSPKERELLDLAKGLPEDMRDALLRHANHLATLARLKAPAPSEE